jgi:hypothetical protein
LFIKFIFLIFTYTAPHHFVDVDDIVECLDIRKAGSRRMTSSNARTSPPGRSPAAAPLRGWMDQSQIAGTKSSAQRCGVQAKQSDSTLIHPSAQRSSGWTSSRRRSPGREKECKKQIFLKSPYLKQSF